MATEAHLKVLVVEDDTDAATVIGLLLERELSASSDLAHDCAAAREKLSTGSYELVTLDYQLPDGDGLQLLEEIAAMEEPPPVVMVTGHGDERTAVRSFGLGASGYVIKDARMKALLVSAARDALSAAACRRAEQDLRECEVRCRFLTERTEAGDLFERLFRHNPALIALSVLPEQRLVDVNDAYLETLGYSREEVIGRTSAELGVFHDPEQQRVVAERLKADGRIADQDMQVRRKDGAVLHGLFSGEVIDIQGRDHFLTVMIDITEEKRAVEALRESEERFRTAAVAASDLIWEWDFDSGHVEWFGDIDGTLGYGPGEFPETIRAWEDALHPEDHDRVMSALLSSRESGEQYYEEYRIRCRDGSYRYWTDSGYVMAGESEAPGRMIGACTDITDRMLAEEQLRRANEELEAYAHSISHDLKGPLSAIDVAADVLGDLIDDSAGADAAEALRLLKRNSKNAVRRIDALLRLAVSAQEPDAVERVNVAGLVGEVLEELSGVIRDKGVAVTVDEEMGELLASREQVRLIFSNLLSNAVKHNDSDRPEARVSRLKAGHDGAHRYLVRDNGSGIPPDKLDAVFVPFQRGRKTGETGIGLSIAKRIAGVYGGGITAYNDDGACFEVTLRDYKR